MAQEQKRVYCLYRVSTLGQVEKDDIPMQKQACREFIATKREWKLYGERAEKGVSGFKVAAKDRDAVQEIQQEALRSNFDVLLVYMFDRLGRRDDETPFVVEWFVRQGIEVWSVKEGQQRFDNHVDKLTNYIRYWQASGESIKTSMRTKTRLGQIVREGRFRGGVAPYGYRLEKRGRFNKKNHELYEIVIDEDEAAVVRKIFELCVMRGYGSQRISTYLTEHGARTRKGANFTNITVANMLKNIAYTGVLRSGETVSEAFPNLRIIDDELFQTARNIMAQRSATYKDRRVPLNTTGMSLLSGNIFCGHCGARLVVTTNGKKYIRKSDGEATTTPRTRYVCYNKTRHREQCDGQTGYTVHILDKIVDAVIRGMFERLRDVPRDAVVAERYAAQTAELRLALTKARAELGARAAETGEYEAEVLKVIRGESKLNPELLNKLHEESKEKAEAAAEAVRSLEEKIGAGEETRKDIVRRFENVKTWADMYDGCDTETKKMILSRLVGAVRVRRDYEVEIDMAVEFERFWGGDGPESVPDGSLADEAGNAAG
jgi:DNA invertase Pin-like site-specific DNA recombinase